MNHILATINASRPDFKHDPQLPASALEILCWALHVEPETEFPSMYIADVQELAKFCVLARLREEKMGRRFSSVESGIFFNCIIIRVSFVVAIYSIHVLL